MTPREFAEHVERESARISALLEEAGTPSKQWFLADEALSELNRLARQHAIEQEQKG